MSINRRAFLKTTATAASAAYAVPYIIPSTAFGANERVVMGIIGSGGRGRKCMQEHQNAGAHFSAVCDVYDPNRKMGREKARESGKKVTNYLDYREMLEKQTDMDAVLIATPEHQHGEQLIATVQAGYDSYCEKPMSHSIAESVKMVREVRKTNRIVQIGMQRRSAPIVRNGKDVVDSGVLGDIHLVRVKWFWNRAKPLDNSPLPGRLDVGRFIHPAKKVDFEPMKFRDWRYFWDFSGGNMTDQGTHLMDVVQWYMGEEFNPILPKSAECFGDVYKATGSETPDVFASIFQYEGFLVNWSLDYGSSYENGWSIEFLGSDAMMQIDRYGYRIHEEPWKADKQDPWKSGKPLADDFRGKFTPQPHVDNFLACVKSREEPNCPVEIGQTAVAAPHLANVAYRNKTRAYLNKDGTKATT